jgi:hypothetical protein
VIQTDSFFNVQLPKRTPLDPLFNDIVFDDQRWIQFSVTTNGAAKSLQQYLFSFNLDFFGHFPSTFFVKILGKPSTAAAFVLTLVKTNNRF